MLLNRWRCLVMFPLRFTPSRTNLSPPISSAMSGFPSPFRDCFVETGWYVISFKVVQIASLYCSSLGRPSFANSDSQPGRRAGRAMLASIGLHSVGVCWAQSKLANSTSSSDCGSNTRQAKDLPLGILCPQSSNPTFGTLPPYHCIWEPRSRGW